MEIDYLLASGGSPPRLGSTTNGNPLCKMLATPLKFISIDDMEVVILLYTCRISLFII